MLLPVSERATVHATGHYPAANTAAVVTIAAKADQCHVIKGIQFSYAGSGTLAGGRLTVVAGSTTLLDFDIDAEGVVHVELPIEGLTNHALNEAVVVTLAAGGANVTGKLNVQYA